MVTDRKIVISNGSTSVELTAEPYTVQKIVGFDRLNVQIATSQGFDQDGASIVNSYVLPRDMQIDGQIYAQTTSRMQDGRDKLLNMFMPKKELLINHYFGGKTRVIKARVEKTPKIDFTNVSKIQNYSVSLLAAEPFWQDQNDTVVSIADTAGHFHFPLMIPAVSGAVFGVKTKSLLVNIYNQSAIKLGMKIVFIANGNVTEPQLINVVTRRYIKMLCSMEAGERITITTGQEKTVVREKNGVSESYIGKVDLAGGGNSFLELDPGDNILRYAAADGEDMLEARIYYNNKYAGV